MTNTVRKWSFDIITVIVLTVAVLFPVTVYVAGASHACNGENTVRTQLLTFIDNTVTRAVASTKATLESPNATAQQKRVASQNLAALQEVDADAHNRVHFSDCSFLGGL